jgi:DNA-binding GntR family transcriptional regulator
LDSSDTASDDREVTFEFTEREGRFSTVHEQLIDALRTSILTGEYPPGRRLRQVAVADRFGVSPVPVREALRALEQEGLVASAPRRGWIVTKLTVAEIREIYELRELLEQKALHDAIPKLTDSQLAELQRLATALISTGTPQQHFEARERFYAVLYGGSGKRRLASLILSLHNQLAPYLRLQRVEHSNESHLQLMDALQARDLERASAVISRHLAEICEVCVKAAQVLDVQGTKVG